MSKNSTRNRHTGEVNAYKQRIIKAGKQIVTKTGRIYAIARLPNS